LLHLAEISSKVADLPATMARKTGGCDLLC
jgi:hypothetical protein